MRFFDCILRLCGFRRVDVRAMAKALGIIVVLVVVLYEPAQPVTASPLTAPLPPECAEIVHHGLSRWTVQYMNAGQGIAWQRGGTLIYAVKVAECGGAWLYAVWRDGNFVTNFFPAAELYAKFGFKGGLSKAWNYIQSKVRGMPRIPPPGFACGAYLPYHFVRTGAKWYQGCWLDANNVRATWYQIGSDGIDWCAKGGY